MIKKALLAGALLVAAAAAVAQTSCPHPTVKVLRNNQEVPATGSALAPNVTLRVHPDSQCPDRVSYKFSAAELTLVRHGRPVMPAMRVNQPQVNLTAWLKVSEPGDRIYIFIPYANLVVISADGKQRPYPQPRPTQPKAAKLDLSTDEAKGISFVWPLV